MSVEPRPASTTSTPRLMTPSANARESGIDDSRMSCAVTTAVAPLSDTTNSAKAAPIARLVSSSHCSGTTPRTSYALMIDESSATEGPYKDPRRGTPRRGGSSAEVGKDPQVAATRAAAVVGGVARGLGAGRLADRVGQRQQVVTGRAGVVEVDLVPHDLPAAGDGQPLGVELAQVVTVRLREGRQRADDGRGLGVHVGQGRRCRLRAAAAGAAT